MNWKRVNMYWEMDAPKELQKEMARKILIFFLIEIGVIVLSCLYVRLKLSWGNMEYIMLGEAEKIQMLKEDVWNGFTFITTIPQLTFIVGTILFWMLPFYGIYRHYYESNSIYTLMRLPGSKKEFYFGKLIPAVVLPIILYVVCSVIYLIPYVMYELCVPELYQYNVSYHLLEGSFFPCSIIDIEKNILMFLAVLEMLLYIPSMLILGIFAERSRKRPLYTILAVGMIALSLWISTPFWGDMFTKGVAGVIELVAMLIASVLCIISGVYYIEKVQLV